MWSTVLLLNLLNRNHHWDPYAFRCNVCNIDYDYILRLENFEEESEIFMDALNIEKNSELRRLQLKQSGNVHETESLDATFNGKYIEYLTKIKAADVTALTEYYKIDMQLFGYSLDVHSFMTSCQISTKDAEICC